VYKQREFEVEGATVLKSLRRARQPATRGRTAERIQASAWRRFRNDRSGRGGNFFERTERCLRFAVASAAAGTVGGRVFTAWTQIVSLYGAYLRSGWCLDMGGGGR